MSEVRNMNTETYLEKEFPEMLEKLLNRSPRRLSEVLSKTLRNMHPTLQQNWWRMVKQVAKDYRNIPYYDDRNRASLKFAKAISGIDIHLPLI